MTDAILAAPARHPFVTMWSPGKSPEEETLSWEQFLSLARKYRSLFRRKGLAPGDRIIIVLPQGIPLLASFAGAVLGGHVPAILAYPTFKADPEKYHSGLVGVTRNLGARAVLIDPGLPEHLAKPLRDSTPMITGDPASLCEGDERGAHFASADDIAFIQHSAGTTGLQKGVALSHRAVLTQLRHLSDALSITRRDCIVSWLPLYHDMGLVACFALALACHLRLVLLSPTDWVLEPWTLLDLASRHRATLCWLPNFAFQFLARRVPEEHRQSLDLSSLRAVVNCSEPVLHESMEEVVHAFSGSGLSPSALATCYAMAENTFAVTHSQIGSNCCVARLTLDRAALRQSVVNVVPPTHPSAVTLVSSGRCLPGTRIRIIGVDEVDLPPGLMGEILIESDSLFGGYFNRSDLTALAFKDGWYRTGDAGFVLDGELYVLGRKDDVIIVAGENFYPQDIEDVACLHPDVHDGRAVAFGVKNSVLGTEDLVIVVEVESEDRFAHKAAIETQVRKLVTEHLGVAPRMVCLVPPKWVVKSTAGKPARSTNRRKFLREHPEADAEGVLGP